ncbi:MAG: SDR family NAD(P)-dependent oxidoreductase [Planctomycetota bacterium]
MSLFKNKNVIITGSSRGIGRSCALKFAQEGANVIINYRKREEKALELLKEIESYGVKALAVRADVSEIEDAHKLIDIAIETFGHIDVLVNNAGIWIETPAGSTQKETIDNVIGVNLKSVIYLSNRIIPHFRARKAGRIINISSTAGQRGEACYSVYAATKGAIISYTKSLSSELAKDGILVNAVAPGWVDTELNDSVFSDQLNKAKIAATIPIGHIPTPDEVAGSVLFLSSPWSSVITGEVLNVNGGSVLCG